MNIRQPSDLATVLQSIQQKLLDDEVFTENSVYISLVPTQLQLPPNDQYLIITPGSQVLDQGSTAGGGRDYNFVKGQVYLTVWVRLALDSTPQDAIYLTDASLGALKTVKCVINSLQVFDPVNGDDDFIMAEPMRFVSIAEPEKTNIPGWGYSQSVWSVNWTIDLSC